MDVFVSQIGALTPSQLLHCVLSGLFSSFLLYFEILIFLCFDYLSNVDILVLLCRLFCRSSVLLEVTTWLLFFQSENNAFSAMYEVCTKSVFWGRNSVRYLYSFWVLFLLYWAISWNQAELSNRGASQKDPSSAHARLFYQMRSQRGAVLFGKMVAGKRFK